MKIHNKLLVFSALSAISLGALSLSAAEPTPAPAAPAPAQAPAKPGHGPKHARLAELAEKLGLTEAQKTQLEPIIKAEAQETKAVFDDTSLTKEARREKLKAINQKYRPQVEAILTPEQQKKFKEIKQDRRENREHGEHGQAPAAK